MGAPYIPIHDSFSSKMDLAYIPRPGDNNLAFGLGPCSKMTQIAGRHENQCWGTMPSQWYLRKDASAACFRESEVVSTDAFYVDPRTNTVKTVSVEKPYARNLQNITDVNSYTLFGQNANPALQKKNREIAKTWRNEIARYVAGGSRLNDTPQYGYESTQPGAYTGVYDGPVANYTSANLGGSSTFCSGPGVGYSGVTLPKCRYN